MWTIAVQPSTNDLYVANASGTGPGVLVFDSTADGNVAPRDIYAGGSTQINSPQGIALSCNSLMVLLAPVGGEAVLNFNTIATIPCSTTSPTSSGSATTAALATTGAQTESNLAVLGLAGAMILLGIAALVPLVRRRRS